MSNDISDKDKKDWQRFISNKEKLYDKDLKNISKKNIKSSSLDLHGYTLDEANKLVEKFINKSHQEKIDTTGAEGIYIGRAIRGSISSGSNTHYYVVASIRGEKMYKKWWVTPELIVEKETEDDVTDEAKSAIIYDKT